jgi:hypothetical protein
VVVYGDVVVTGLTPEGVRDEERDVPGPDVEVVVYGDVVVSGLTPEGVRDEERDVPGPDVEVYGDAVVSGLAPEGVPDGVVPGPVVEPVVGHVPAVEVPT